MRGKRGTLDRMGRTKLGALVAQAKGERSVQQVADLCGVPYWVIRDIVYGHSKKPSSAHLEAISRGLDIPLADIALAAYEGEPQEVSA